MHPTVRLVLGVTMATFAIAFIGHIFAEYLELENTMKAAQVTMMCCGIAVFGALFCEAVRHS